MAEHGDELHVDLSAIVPPQTWRVIGDRGSQPDEVDLGNGITCRPADHPDSDTELFIPWRSARGAG